MIGKVQSPENQAERIDKITAKMMIEIINPGPIFMSSFMPAVTGVLFVLDKGFALKPLLVTALLLIACLANAIADLLNDYYDYVNGTDKMDNIATEQDGPLAYHNISNPKPVLYMAVLFTAIFVALGLYVVHEAGAAPLVIGGFGFLVMWLYSGKYINLSHLPLGEILAGGCLGGLIPLGVYVSLTGELDFWILFKAVPLVLAVANLCLVNNTCDIERDIESGRHTLPILIGRKNARRLAQVLTAVWALQFLAVIVLYFPFGFPIFALIAFLIWKPFVALFRYERTLSDKAALMGSLGKVAFPIVMGYPLAIAVNMIVRNIIF